MADSEQLIMGFHAIEAALAAENISKIIIDARRVDQRMQALLDQAKKMSVLIEMRSHEEIERLIGKGQRYQSVIALLKHLEVKKEKALWSLLDALVEPPLLLILDGVTDPHNVGACLRTAEAFGVHAVIVPDNRACGLTASVRKVASGSAERIPFIQVTNLVRVMQMLQERGIWITGLAGEASQFLYSLDLQGNTALVMGAEGEGMRRLTKAHCDYLAKIPLQGDVESLNVSVAAGVALYEAFRQRHLSK